MLINNEKLLTEAREKVTAYEKRESEIAGKEAKLLTTELDAKHQKERSDEMKELVGLVFRNPVVKESSFNNSYRPEGSYTANTDKTTTTE